MEMHTAPVLGVLGQRKSNPLPRPQGHFPRFLETESAEGLGKCQADGLRLPAHLSPFLGSAFPSLSGHFCPGFLPPLPAGHFPKGCVCVGCPWAFAASITSWTLQGAGPDGSQLLKCSCVSLISLRSPLKSHHLTEAPSGPFT